MLKNVLSFSVLLMSLSAPAFADDDGGLKVGETAPCVTLNQILPDGSEANGCVTDPVKKEQSFTIINFMSIYCGPCNDELPVLAKLVEEVSSVATVRSISIEKKKYENEVRSWLKESAKEGFFNHPYALDMERVAANGFKIKYTPTLFVVDKNKKVVFVHVGSLGVKDIDIIKKAMGY